jgi:hypothetical protein
MTEQVPTVPYSDAIPKIHDPVATSNQPFFEPGTYVIQIPRDQIYRVPPPGNASVAQRQRNPHQKKHKSCCGCSCFWCCFIAITSGIAVAVTIVGLSFILLKPKDPEFQVQRFVVKNPQVSKHKYSYTNYDIRLNVHNSNRRSSILYQQGGAVSLSFRQQNVATGKFPTFHQGHKNSTDIGIVLKGTGVGLPKDVQNSLRNRKSKVPDSFSLKMNVPVKMKTSGFKTGRAEIVVTCDFTVQSLAQDTHILSQECQTNR